MTNIAIRVDHLSKLYRIGRAQQRHDRQETGVRSQESGVRHQASEDATPVH